jgi:hypothetical protein
VDELDDLTVMPELLTVDEPAWVLNISSARGRSHRAVEGYVGQPAPWQG